MANSYSNIEAQEIIASANAAAVAIGELIRERLGYELEIAELYKKLLDQGGNELARCISLVRTGPGKYRTPAAGKKGGTASNLYLAATSGTDAVIETRSDTYRAQECYERALNAAGINEYDDAFEDLVFAGYKRWLHEEINDKSLSEWKALKSTIEHDAKAAEPALQGGLSRLFMNAQAKQEAFDALDELKRINVAGIVFDLEFWREKSTQTYFIKEDVLDGFRHYETQRNDILGCLHAQLGDFELNGGIRRPFYAEEVQRVLDELEGVSGLPGAVSAARQAVTDPIPAAIEELKESDVLAKLAQHPIEELAEAKTGAQIKKLQDAGVHTLADLYERLNAPERGELPGVGAKTRSAIEKYLDPIVAEARSRWSLHLSAREQGDAATRLVRTVGAYIELGKLLDKAQEALAGQDALSAQQTDDLLFATDDIDWLLTDDDHVQAASGAMDAARAYLDTKDGAWLLSLSRGSRIKKLENELVSADKAWKDFEKRPDAFYEVIEQLAPEALVQPEPASAEAEQPEAAATVEAKPTQATRATTEPADFPEPHDAPRPVAQQETSADLLEQMRTFYQKFEGLTMMFPSAEDAPVFNAKSKYSVRADAPRAQGSTFSLAIPDGWVSDEDTAGRAFVLVPKSHAGEGMESPVAILYGKAPVGEDYATAMQQSGIPPIQWATHYVARSLAANFTCEMHEVEARNCRCAVVRVPTADEECSEFYIYPYSLVGQDYARVTFYGPEDVTREEARAFVDDLARTVEIDGPTTPAIMERLEGRVAEATSLEEVDKVISPIPATSTLFCQEVFDAALRFYQSRVGEGNTTFERLAGTSVCALNQYCDVSVPLMDRIFKLLSAWIDLHPLRAEELEYCGNMLSSLAASSTIGPATFNDFKEEQPEFYAELVKLCTPTPKQRVLLDKIEALRKALNLPDSVDNNDNRAAPTEEVVPVGEREPDSEPAPARGEGMDLVTFLLTFLSRSWFFFGGDVFSGDDGISWDGSQHSVTNLKINAVGLQEMKECIREFDAGFEDEQEVGNYLIAFLNELEKDKGLRVPRKRIARGVQKVLLKGPLTGMTLAGLCESSHGLTFKGGFDRYEVYFDTRLSKGIPQFFSLIARMLWDMRAGVSTLKGRPFDIMFLAARSLDANLYLGVVDEPVEGAQECPVLMQVTELPEVNY